MWIWNLNICCEHVWISTYELMQSCWQLEQVLWTWCCGYKMGQMNSWHWQPNLELGVWFWCSDLNKNLDKDIEIWGKYLGQMLWSRIFSQLSSEHSVVSLLINVLIECLEQTFELLLGLMEELIWQHWEVLILSIWNLNLNENYEGNGGLIEDIRLQTFELVLNLNSWT